MSATRPLRPAIAFAISFGVLSTTAFAQDAGPIVATFACPHGQSLTVTFENGAAPAATIRLPTGTEKRLPQELSADGFRYGDGSAELRGKGNQVTWTDGGSAPMTCKAKP